jgi:hypothetical protein
MSFEKLVPVHTSTLEKQTPKHICFTGGPKSVSWFLVCKREEALSKIQVLIDARQKKKVLLPGACGCL